MSDAPHFRRIGLIAKLGDERVARTLAQLVAHLRTHPVDLLLDDASAPAAADLGLESAERAALGERCDLVVVIAGDGTFLAAARSLVAHDVPLLGVNLGRLGFLADVMPAEMTDRVDEILAGHHSVESRFLLEAAVVRGGEVVHRVDALNDVVAHKWNIARLVEFETRIDDSLVSVQRSDGLIVSTPTGSTAYALSGGGPIVHPALDAIVLVSICPHTLSARPLVVGADSRIEIRLALLDERDAHLSCDGQLALGLEPGDRLLVRRKRERLRLVHPQGQDYYATLRAKLHWGKAP